jgi:hypothetical protein
MKGYKIDAIDILVPIETFENVYILTIRKTPINAFHISHQYLITTTVKSNNFHFLYFFYKLSGTLLEFSKRANLSRYGEIPPLLCGFTIALDSRGITVHYVGHLKLRVHTDFLTIESHSTECHFLSLSNQSW